jgi:large subunit ribosomal protein L5
MSLTLSATDYKTQAIAKTRSVLGADKSNFALPELKMISINVGVGKFESKEKQEIFNFLYKITGQKPKQVKSRQSISNFKLRKGEINGIVVTLRGQKMYDFMLSLVYLALPVTRDFRGLKKNAFDKNYSSYSLGIPSTSIFPQVGFDAPVNFGMQINICFRTNTEENKVLLESFNFPFVKA